MLNSSSEVIVRPALHNTLQHNCYDCGVHVARRFYSLWKFNEVFHPNECEMKIMEIIPFRLFMLQCILEASVNVSCYVSPTGLGNTSLIPFKNGNENTEPTPVVGRVTRNGPIKKKAIMPTPDGQEIFDVDETPNDDDEIAKNIAENVLYHSKVNMNFDRDLLLVDDAIEKADAHLLHEFHENDLMLLEYCR